MELTIKVICKDLPGAEFHNEEKGLHYRDVHVGIQHGEKVIEAVRGDTKKAEFAPVFRVAEIEGGMTNFLGHYAKGSRNERFFYLSWGELPAGGLFRMFRRAKIHLSHLKWTQVEGAAKANEPITVELSLTDKHGWPLCASVKPPYVEWKI
jgi:hypothetical protein